MNEWKCGDLKCVQKPTRGRLSLTHPYSRWAWSESPCNQSGRKGKGLRRKGFAEAPSLEFRMKFWASKRWCEMFKLSTSGLVWFTCLCSLPKSLLINRMIDDRLLNVWPTVNQTTHRHCALLPWFCTSQDYRKISSGMKSGMSNCQVGCYDEVRRLATKQLNGCVRT